MNRKQHNISLYVNNKPGVLIRIALVFARRGYNIDSLVVSRSNDPDFSRMTITATGDPDTLNLMLKQLNRLVDVVYAKDLTDLPVLKKELALFKVRTTDETRTEILQLIHAFGVNPMDISPDCVVFSIDASGEKIDGIRQVLTPYGLIEVIRSGKIIMSRGAERT